MRTTRDAGTRHRAELFFCLSSTYSWLSACGLHKFIFRIVIVFVDMPRLFRLEGDGCQEAQL